MAQPIPQVPVTGTAAELAAVRLAKGQLAHATDTGDWYVGDGATLVAGITPQSSGTSVAPGWVKVVLKTGATQSGTDGNGVDPIAVEMLSASAEGAPTVAVDGLSVVLDPTKAYAVSVDCQFTTDDTGNTIVYVPNAPGAAARRTAAVAASYEDYINGTLAGVSALTFGIYADAGVTVDGLAATIAEY